MESYTHRDVLPMIGDINSQPIRNMISNPLPSSTFRWFCSNFGAGGTATIGYDSALQAFYSEVTVQATNTAHTVRYGTNITNYVPVEPGRTYYQRFEVMSTVDDARAFAVDWLLADGGSVSSSSRPDRVALPAGQWVTIDMTVTAPATAAFASACVIYNGGASGPSPVIRPVGSRLHTRRAIFCDTTHPSVGPWMPYVDGNSSGWLWTGTVGQSISVGYHHSLPDAIVGSPLFWLDARYPLGIGVSPPADGTTLATWADVSGRGLHATQPIASKQPTWTTSGWAGLPTVNFDGTDDVLEAISPVTSSGAGDGGDFTVYTIFHADRAGGTNAYWGNAGAIITGEYPGYTTDWGVAIGVGGSFNGGVGTTTGQIPGLPASMVSAHIGTFIRSKAAATVQVAVDGVQSEAIAGHNQTLAAGTEVGIGGSPTPQSSDGTYLDGRISAIIIFRGAHNTATRKLVESYLSRTYGVPLAA